MGNLRKHNAEKYAKGFTCRTQFVSMYFVILLMLIHSEKFAMVSHVVSENSFI